MTRKGNCRVTFAIIVSCETVPQVLLTEGCWELHDSKDRFGGDIPNHNYIATFEKCQADCLAMLQCTGGLTNWIVTCANPIYPVQS